MFRSALTIIREYVQLHGFTMWLYVLPDDGQCWPKHVGDLIIKIYFNGCLKRNFFKNKNIVQ